MFADESPRAGLTSPAHRRSQPKKDEKAKMNKVHESESETYTLALPALPPMNVSAAFDELPFDVRKEANELLTQFVTTVVRSNPLGKGLRPIVIKETINDVAEQLHSTMGVALAAYRDQIGVHWETMKKDERRVYLTCHPNPHSKK